MDTANKKVLQIIVATVQKRDGITMLEKVKGHAGIKGNEEADKLANEGAQKTTPDKINLIILQEYHLLSAKLAKLAQATAYRGIIGKVPKPYQKGITTHLDMMRWAMKKRLGDFPTDKQI